MTGFFKGVDDAFLMLGAWRTTDRRWSVEKRMAVTMSDAGASITATSMTNFGCFGNQFWPATFSLLARESLKLF